MAGPGNPSASNDSPHQPKLPSAIAGTSSPCARLHFPCQPLNNYVCQYAAKVQPHGAMIGCTQGRQGQAAPDAQRRRAWLRLVSGCCCGCGC